MFTGKATKIFSEERDKIREKKFTQRAKYELKNLGDFELAYPPENPDTLRKYESFLELAKDVWEEFTTGKKCKKRAEEKKIEIQQRQKELAKKADAPSNLKGKRPPSSNNTAKRSASFNQHKPTSAKNTSNLS